MMRRYRYIKSNAFTAGESLGNPAACLFLDDAPMTGEQMQSIASEHKGFVMEMVFCGQSEKADAKLTYYSDSRVPSPASSTTRSAASSMAPSRTSTDGLK